MDRILSYALVLTIGIAATTISAAVVGEPIPVFVPAVVGFLAVAGHHVFTRESSSNESPGYTAVYTDGRGPEDHR